MYSMIHSFFKFLIRTQTKSLINVIFSLLLASKQSIIWNNVTKKLNRKTELYTKHVHVSFEVIRMERKLSWSQPSGDVLKAEDFRSGIHPGDHGAQTPHLSNEALQAQQEVQGSHLLGMGLEGHAQNKSWFYANTLPSERPTDPLLGLLGRGSWAPPCPASPRAWAPQGWVGLLQHFIVTQMNLGEVAAHALLFMLTQ